LGDLAGRKQGLAAHGLRSPVRQGLTPLMVTIDRLIKAVEAMRPEAERTRCVHKAPYLG